jgi:hypothetical protein
LHIILFFTILLLDIKGALMKKSGHTDVASSLTLCKSIIEDAESILTSLPEGETELPTWWTNKLAICYAYINSLRDYAVYQGFEEDDEEEPETGDEGNDNASSEELEMEDEDEDMIPPSARMMRNAS